MAPWVTLAESALLVVVLCGLHALKPRFGLTALYAAIGMVVAFMFTLGNQHADGARISAEIFFSEPGSIATMLFFPALLSSVVLVYVLEGTRAARHLLAAIALLYVVHGAVELFVYQHAANPPDGMPDLRDSPLVAYNLSARAASLAAIFVDFVVILVTYQLLVNRAKRLPLVVPIFLALIAGMVVDGIVYNTLRARSISWERLWLMEKLQAGIVAGVPVSVYLGWQLSRHKDEIRRGILGRGALAIIDLRRRVAQIERELADLRSTFGRYVSNEVVEQLLDDPSKLELGGEVRQVTILFADIRGYSTLAESLEATEVIDLLNRYFQGVTRVILDNKGMINEFEGDAVLAVFGAPLDLGNHAELAVNSALGMLDAVRDLNAEWELDGTAARWRAAGVDGLAIRIGIHSGEVVAGNIGSEVRTKYAVIGDTVNTASRVEGLNKTLRTSVLLTDRTRAELLQQCAVLPPLVDLGSHVVKGRTEPVQVFTIENAYPEGEEPGRHVGAT